MVIGGRSGIGDVEMHGGRLREARRMFPGAPEPLLDLSTGINPHAYPMPALAPETWHRLPDPDDERMLRAMAARCYGMVGEDHVAAAPGSQLLISLLPVLLRPRRAVVLAPTYGEHAAAWRNAGIEVEEVREVETLVARADAGVVMVLCEPNNPDGRRLGRARMARLIEAATARGATLVVDEAFADLEPDAGSAAAPSPSPGVCALRSFGKCFGHAGIRLGFLLGDVELAERTRRMLGPWAVGGPAIAVGTAALSDRAWIERMAIRLESDVARMDALLERRGLAPSGGTLLFRLAAATDAQQRWTQLGRAGVLVRRFPSHPHWLRFGHPGDETEWERLDAALASPSGR